MATASIEMVEADKERRSLEELDHEIGELSAHLDAATCRLLLTVAEFDRREGWAQSGFRSCAHWKEARPACAPVAGLALEIAGVVARRSDR